MWTWIKSLFGLGETGAGAAAAVSTGSSSLWLVLGAVLVLTSAAAGAVAYVEHLRAEVATRDATIATKQSAIDGLTHANQVDAATIADLQRQKEADDLALAQAAADQQALDRAYLEWKEKIAHAPASPACPLGPRDLATFDGVRDLIARSNPGH